MLVVSVISGRDVRAGTARWDGSAGNMMLNRRDDVMTHDCNKGRFLDYLGRIESCAAAGYADIALLPSLVLPDVLGTYLCDKRGLQPVGKSGCKSGGKYKAAMRELLHFDRKLYGFSRVCHEFGAFGVGMGASDKVCDALYLLRCCLAHGGNIRIRNMPDVTYVLDTEPGGIDWFVGVNSVYPLHMPSLLYCSAGAGPGIYKPGVVVNIGRLVHVMCSTVREFYLAGDDDLKSYLDDFNRTVVFERGVISDAVVSGRSSVDRGKY